MLPSEVERQYSQEHKTDKRTSERVHLHEKRPSDMDKKRSQERQFLDNERRYSLGSRHSKAERQYSQADRRISEREHLQSKHSQDRQLAEMDRMYSHERRVSGTADRIYSQVRMRPSEMNKTYSQEKHYGMDKKYSQERKPDEIDRQISRKGRMDEMDKKYSHERRPDEMDRIYSREKRPNEMERIYSRERGPDEMEKMYSRERGPDEMERKYSREKKTDEMDRIYSREKGPDEMDRIYSRERGPDEVDRIYSRERRPDEMDRIYSRERRPDEIDRIHSRERGSDEMGRIYSQERINPSKTDQETAETKEERKPSSPLVAVASVLSAPSRLEKSPPQTDKSPSKTERNPTMDTSPSRTNGPQTDRSLSKTEKIPSTIYENPSRIEKSPSGRERCPSRVGRLSSQDTIQSSSPDAQDETLVRKRSSQRPKHSSREHPATLERVISSPVDGARRPSGGSRRSLVEGERSENSARLSGKASGGSKRDDHVSHEQVFVSTKYVEPHVVEQRYVPATYVVPSGQRVVSTAYVAPPSQHNYVSTQYVELPPQNGYISTTKMAEPVASEKRFVSTKYLEPQNGYISTTKMAEPVASEKRFVSTKYIEPQNGYISTTKMAEPVASEKRFVSTKYIEPEPIEPAYYVVPEPAEAQYISTQYIEPQSVEQRYVTTEYLEPVIPEQRFVTTTYLEPQLVEPRNVSTAKLPTEQRVVSSRHLHPPSATYVEVADPGHSDQHFVSTRHMDVQPPSASGTIRRGSSNPQHFVSRKYVGQLETREPSREKNTIRVITQKDRVVRHPHSEEPLDEDFSDNRSDNFSYKPKHVDYVTVDSRERRSLGQNHGASTKNVGLSKPQKYYAKPYYSKIPDLCSDPKRVSFSTHGNSQWEYTDTEATPITSASCETPNGNVSRATSNSTCYDTMNSASSDDPNHVHCGILPHSCSRASGNPCLYRRKSRKFYRTKYEPYIRTKSEDGTSRSTSNDRMYPSESCYDTQVSAKCDGGDLSPYDRVNPAGQLCMDADLYLTSRKLRRISTQPLSETPKSLTCDMNRTPSLNTPSLETSDSAFCGAAWSRKPLPDRDLACMESVASLPDDDRIILSPTPILHSTPVYTSASDGNLACSSTFHQLRHKNSPLPLRACTPPRYEGPTSPGYRQRWDYVPSLRGYSKRPSPSHRSGRVSTSRYSRSRHSYPSHKPEPTEMHYCYQTRTSPTKHSSPKRLHADDIPFSSDLPSSQFSRRQSSPSPRSEPASQPPKRRGYCDLMSTNSNRVSSPPKRRGASDLQSLGRFSPSHPSSSPRRRTSPVDLPAHGFSPHPGPSPNEHLVSPSKKPDRLETIQGDYKLFTPLHKPGPEEDSSSRRLDAPLRLGHDIRHRHENGTVLRRVTRSYIDSENVYVCDSVSSF
jgi:hypothetical protein